MFWQRTQESDKIKKKVIEAIYGSIVKWESIKHNKDFDYGRKNCPLCKIFFNGECRNCPVSNKSGRAYCKKTPYEAWTYHQYLKHTKQCITGVFAIKCKVCEQIVNDEIKFLISLLPRKRRRVSK